MRSFKKALNDVIQSRRAIANMNSLYPNATVQDLQETDNICIICREEMVGTQIVNGVVVNPPSGLSKKLPCGHIFHVSCLRSWFQRQQTCPTCRLDVLRAGVAARSYANNNNNNNNNNHVNNANVLAANQPNAANPLQQQQQQLFQQMFLTHLLMNAHLNADPAAAAGLNQPQQQQPTSQQQQNQQAQQQQTNQQHSQQQRQNGSGRNTAPANNTETSGEPQASSSGQSTTNGNTSSSNTQGTSATATNTAPTATATPTSTATASASASTSATNTFPSFPTFLPSITSLPVPPSSLDLSRLSDRELALLVRREREGLEARLNLYAQSRILIDAAITNLLQFNSALAASNVERRNSNVDEYVTPVNVPNDLIEESESNETTGNPPSSSSGRILSEEELFRRRTHSDVRRVRVSRFSGRSEATSLPSHNQTGSSNEESTTTTPTTSTATSSTTASSNQEPGEETQGASADAASHSHKSE